MSSLLFRLASRRPAVATLPQRVELSVSALSLTAVAGASGTVATSTRVRNNAASGGVLQAPATGAVSYTSGGTGWVASVTLTATGAEWVAVVTANPAAVSAGVHVATIPIYSFGALDSPRTLTVTFTATAVQQALLTLSDIIDDAVASVGGANPPSEVVSIFSGNSTSLAGPTIKSYWFTGALSNFATPSIAGAQLRVDYDLSAQSTPGTGFLHTEVEDTAASNTMVHQTYLVLGQAPVPAVLSVSQSAVTPTIQVGSSAAALQVVASNGGNGGYAALGTVTCTLQSAVSWVSLSFDAATGIATLTWSTSALTAGQYSNLLTFTASGVSNGPITVPIQLTVQATQVVPLLQYTLPTGLTQNATTGFIEGTVTSAPSTQPSGWNAAATYSITAASLPTPSSAFQTALTNSRSQNDPVIEVDAGLTLSGNFILGARTGTGWLTIRTANHASLAARGTRVHPSTDAAHMFTVSSPNADPVLRFMSANKTYLLGMRFTDTAPQINYGQIMLAPSRYDSTLNGYVTDNIADQSNQSEDVYFDRCIGKGKLNAGQAMNFGSYRGIYASCKRLGMDDCYLYDYMSVGTECQAVLIIFGGNAYQFRNTHMCAAGECFMTGGAKIPFEDDSWNPRDIYFKQCEFAGRLEWFSARPEYVGIDPASGSSQPYGFKNLFEIKRGHRVLVDGCVAHTSMVLGQLGHSFVYKSDNNNSNNLSTPTVSATTNVQQIHCWTYLTKGSVTIQGNASPKLGVTVANDRHHILENLAERINVAPNPGNVYIHSVENRATNILVERNIWALNGGSTPQGACTVGRASNVVWIDNIMPQCTYGFFGTAVGEGTPAFNAFWSGYTFARNWLYGGSTSTLYPATNNFPASEAAVQFGVAAGAGNEPSDFALLPTSPCYAGGIFNDALARIQARTAGVVSP